MAIITGKWKWNSTITSNISFNQIDVSFTSNNTEYTYMQSTFGTGYVTLQYGNADTGSIAVAENDGAGTPIIVTEAYRIIDFGSEKQEIPDEAYNFIKSNAILLAPDLSFIANVTVDHDLSILGTLSINSGITGISAKDVGAYSTAEIDEKFSADYKVGDEKTYSVQSKTGFFIQNNFKETFRDGVLTGDYEYIQTSWPSIRYDYGELEPKILWLGQAGQGQPDYDGMYYANYSKFTHTENALRVFHTSYEIEGGVQLKLAHNKILGELADWDGEGGQNLFTATTDVFEAPSLKTNGVITIGETVLDEETLKALISNIGNTNAENLIDEDGQEVSF